jgi:hypothetical protein
MIHLRILKVKIQDYPYNLELLWAVKITPHLHSPKPRVRKRVAPQPSWVAAGEGLSDTRPSERKRFTTDHAANLR